MKRALLLALALAAFGQLSCKLNDYCLECGTGDAKPGDGGTMDAIDAPVDGGDAGSCVPTGDEVCDGKDNDCDGLIDEGVLPNVGSTCDTIGLPTQGECAGGTVQCTPKFHCSVTVATSCFGTNDTTTCPATETCVAEDVSTDHLSCTKFPSPEVCDGKDNNCNGMVDEGDPGGGGRCGNGTGTCVQGVMHCDITAGSPTEGTLVCTGGTGPQMEICDGLDNDCDGVIDDNLGSLGTCGTSMTGACHLGTNTCVGGNVVCTGAVNPTFELCNGIDDDCDGSIDEDFNLQTDPQNCGSCGNICGSGLPNGGNALWGCSAGQCVITACKSGFWDNDGNAANGCEFGACFKSGAEVCDGVDNDCDGKIDETPAIGSAPNICASKGECKGTTASCPCANMSDSAGCTTGGTCVTTCTNQGGWECNYPATVSVDSSGNIIPETACDNLDNDCDGIIDNNQPQMEHADCAGYIVGDAAACPFTGPACNDGNQGICRGTGNYTCNSAAPTGPAVCDITSPGQTPGTETCNNLDDDCDGNVDEGANTGNLPGQNWVDIGGGHQMMQYEASRPDATSTDAGTVGTTVCSQAGSQPWVNVTYAQALAACQSVGATLCTDQEWHRTCSANASSGNNLPTVYPVTTSGSGLLIEAEDYFQASYATSTGTGAATHSWVEDETAGFFGISDMLAQPDTGASISAANAPTQSPRLDYQLIFNTSSTNYHVCVHMFASGHCSSTTTSNCGTSADCPSGESCTSNNNAVFVGINSSLPGTANASTLVNNCSSTGYPCWQWITSAALTVTASASPQYVSLYMQKDGAKVDSLYVVNGTCPATLTNSNEAGVVNGAGFKWAMQPATTPPNNYTSGVCNDQNYTGTGSGAPLASGSLASCYADDSGLKSGSTGVKTFDLSGNVKEWTLAHQPGENPIRGGAFDDTSVGIDCPGNFLLADDKFFFPDVGFRCCR